MKHFALIIVAFTVTITCHAQYFQFSQYNYTTQRLNPASVGSSNYATASGVFRNQSTGSSFNLKSTILNAAYPLINRRNGVRWSGIGLSFMDDGTGQNGLYNHTEVGLSYAINVPVAKYKTLSVGFKTLYADRHIDPAGLLTESQFIPDRGFEPGIESGEDLDKLRNKFVTFSAGIYWQQLDRKGNKISSLGLSVFDINQPDDNFLVGNNPYLSTFVLSAGARVFQRDKLGLYPDLLLTRNAAINLVTVGMVTGYTLTEYRNEPDDRLNIITRYTISRSAILGLQLQKQNFSVGFSYDFPISAASVANAGAFEVGLEIRRLIDPRKKAKEKAAAQKAQAKTTTKPKPVPVTKKVTADSAKAKSQAHESELSKRLKQKQDSIQALARPGDLEQEPLLLEEATLRFGFDFNSSELDESSSKYIDDLAGALIDNPDLNVQLTGHTDNVGSAKFNQRLSVERATTMKEELVKRGVDPERITVYGKGLTEPLNDNITPEDRAMNRRVEMKIFYD
jgi:type IX secretion system PorP/SprF family membrane protein